MVSYEDLLAGNAARKKGVRDQIAIIYAQGPILFGEGNETQIGDKNFVKAIEDAAKSKRVKASLIILFLAIIGLKVFTTVLTFDWFTGLFSSI